MSAISFAIPTFAAYLAGMTQWTVRADYDADAKYWYVFDSDVLGLSTGAKSLDTLAAKLSAIIADLLELNAHLILDKSRLAGPHSFRLIAHHETQRAIAA